MLYVRDDLEAASGTSLPDTVRCAEHGSRWKNDRTRCVISIRTAIELQLGNTLASEGSLVSLFARECILRTGAPRSVHRLEKDCQGVGKSKVVQQCQGFWFYRPRRRRSGRVCSLYCHRGGRVPDFERGYRRGVRNRRRPEGPTSSEGSTQERRLRRCAFRSSFFPSRGPVSAGPYVRTKRLSSVQHVDLQFVGVCIPHHGLIPSSHGG